MPIRGAGIGVGVGVRSTAVGATGVNALTRSIIVNGQSVDATYYYDARNWNGLAFLFASAGEYLAKVENGADLTKVDEGLSSGVGLEYAGGDYLEASTTGFANLDTDDAVFETVFTCDATTDYLVGKRTTGAGYDQWITSSRQVRSVISDGTTTVFTTSSALSAGTLYHVLTFVDRSEASVNGMRQYINGSINGTVDPSAVTGNVSYAGKLKLGANMDGSIVLNGSIVQAAMWQGAGWLDNSSTTEIDAIAAARYASLIA